MADAKQLRLDQIHLFYRSTVLQYDGYCSYEPMQDLIDAYWDVDGKNDAYDITMEQRKERYAEIWKDFKDIEPISIHRKSATNRYYEI
ncbi:hypothetical protein NXX78_24405 [Bacteroides fragilis]|nr:hypothetical protein [Bacteroides fragilis]